MNNLNDKNDNKSLSKLIKKLFNDILNIFKNIFSSRIFIAMLFLIIGSMATYSCTHHNKIKKHYNHSFYHSFFEDDDEENEGDLYGFHDSFFDEFEAAHKRMEYAMRQHRKMINKAFEINNKQNSSAENKSENQLENSTIKASLQNFQDDKSYNFELQFSGIKPEDISVLIEKNYLIFSSKKAEITATKNDDNSLQSSASSDFYYATYLPTYDEKIAPEIVKNLNKINVKLMKKGVAVVIDKKNQEQNQPKATTPTKNN